MNERLFIIDAKNIFKHANEIIEWILEYFISRKRHRRFYFSLCIN